MKKGTVHEKWLLSFYTAPMEAGDELSTKYIFVANSCKLLNGLMTYEKEANEKDRNKSTCSN